MSEKAMAHYPNLWRRGTRYYLRKRVPADLFAALGKKTHVVVSLRTGDRRIAERKYGVELGNVERQFEQIRAEQQQTERVDGLLGAGKLDRLASVDLEALVHDWFRETVQPVSLGEPDDRHEWATDVKATIADLESDDPDQWRDHVEHVADQILLRAGTPPQADHRRIQRRVRTPAINKASLQYQHLCRLVRRALLVGSRRDLADLAAVPLADIDPLFSIGSTKPVARPTGMTLDDLIRAFESDPSRAGQSTKTGIEYSMVFRAMREVIGGDKDVKAITREDCRKVLNVFIAMPSNATKKFPKLTLSQAVEHATGMALPRLATKTVNNYIVKMASLLNWAVQEEFIDRNPARGLKVEAGVGDSKEREPFSPQQLQAIFEAPLYTGCQDDGGGYAKPGVNRPKGTRFWIPLLGLFHGMRLNECCQLRVEDITEREGVPVMLVRKGLDQKVKSRAAIRVVPIHPEVLRLGFMDYVDRAKAAGHGRLFPELRRDSRGYHSKDVQRWFARFLEGRGIEGMGFHNFRHGFADRLRAAGVPKDRRDALGGWADASIGARYGNGPPTSMLAADIASITYPGLDLSHL